MPRTEANTLAAVAEHGAHVAPETASSKKGATPNKRALRGQETVKRAKGKLAARKTEAKDGKKAANSERNAVPRAESKGARILQMIGRAKGATLAEIMKAAGWQAHSVRGFISTASTKHGVEIESTKNEAGDRVYRAVK